MSYYLKPKLLLLKPKRIVCSINTLRKYYDDYDIKNLADSIAVNGIIEPLIVNENEAGEYELAVGLKRLKAALLLNLRRVPCIVIKATGEDMAFLSLSENLKRTSLNFFEEAEGIKQIINRYDKTCLQVSERLGISSSALLNKLNLLKLSPAIRERIIKSGLSERHARTVLLVPEEKQSQFLDRIIKDELGPAETKDLCEKILLGLDAENEDTKDIPASPVRKVAIGDVRLFANSLSKLIDTMKSTGVEAYSRRSETDKYIEYRVRIVKPNTECFNQLKLV